MLTRTIYLLNGYEIPVTIEWAIGHQQISTQSVSASMVAAETADCMLREAS